MSKSLSNWLTDRATRALQLARNTALCAGRDSIEPAHILVGLVEEQGIAAYVLKHFKISRSDVRLAVLSTVPFGSRQELERSQADIPFADASIKALDNAAAEAKSLGHGFVGTEHLLLALAGDESVPFLELGVTPEEIRNALLALLGGSAGELDSVHDRIQDP